MLFVGAGRHQRRALERVREPGARVVAVDRNEDAPGFAVADEAEVVDFRHVEAVTDVGRRHEVGGVMTFADGGHNYPLHYRTATGTIEQLQGQGIVLGIVPEPRFEQHATVIDAGDVVCFYTDGVTEAMDARRQLFGEISAQLLQKGSALG